MEKTSPIRKKQFDTEKFLAYVKAKKAVFWDAKKIANSLGMSTTTYKKLLRAAKNITRLEKG